MSILSSTSTCTSPATPEVGKHTVLRHMEKNGWVTIEVQYENAKYYEGKKILVYRAHLEDVLTQKVIDPHFCDDGHLAPFARFEPTKEGWFFASVLMEVLWLDGK